MIKKIKKIKTVRNKYEIDIDVFELTPVFISQKEKEIQYLAGGYYSKTYYPMVVLYESDKEGKVLDYEPVIHEEGIPTYHELFKMVGYTVIDN